MKMTLSCPSKTFILGEYFVIQDGSAMIASTKPRFELVVNTRGTGSVLGINAQSPAGIWLRNNKLVFKNIDLEFRDPHNGLGGFGASTAQYLLTYTLTDILKNSAQEEKINIESLWRAYRQVESVSAEGLRPSGADIVAQYKGGLCLFDSEPFQVQSFKWPFEDYTVLLAHTGHKVATHEHLRSLKRLQTDELAVIYSRARETLMAKDSPAFFDSVNDYYAELLELGLVAQTTQVIVATLLSTGLVPAVKGCGALGSDVIAIFVSNDAKESVRKIMLKLNLKEVGSTDVIDKGLDIIYDEQNEDVVAR